MMRKFWGAVWDAVVVMCCIYMLVSVSMDWWLGAPMKLGAAILAVWFVLGILVSKLQELLGEG